MIITHFSVTVQNNELSIFLSECNIFKNKNNMNKIAALFASFADRFFFFVQQTKVKPVILYLRAGQINCRVNVGQGHYFNDGYLSYQTCKMKTLTFSHIQLP